MERKIWEGVATIRGDYSMKLDLERIIHKYGIIDGTAKKNLYQTLEQNKSEIEGKQIWAHTIQKYSNEMDDLKTKLEEHQAQIKRKSTKEKEAKLWLSEKVSDLEEFFSLCMKEDCDIVLTGTMKSGKTTLLNNLLELDLLQTAVHSETTIVTKVRASEKAYHSLKITFYTKEEWDIIWNDAIMAENLMFLEEFYYGGGDYIQEQYLGAESILEKFEDIEELKQSVASWTSSKTITPYFLKEVEIQLADSDIPKNVTYIDIPEFEDLNRYRHGVALEYIQKAKAVLICVKAEMITGKELNTIYQIFETIRQTNTEYDIPYKIEHTYIIGTQIDKLQDPIEEFREQKALLMKYLSKESCYAGVPLARQNILGTTAIFHEAIRKSIEQELDLEKSLNKAFVAFHIYEETLDDNINVLKNYANIDFLKEKIKSNITDPHERFLLEKIAHYYEKNETNWKFFLKARPEIAEYKMISTPKSNEEKEVISLESSVEAILKSDIEAEAVPKRRGRKKKDVAEATTDSETDAEAEAVPKRRGRKKKEVAEATTDSETDTEAEAVPKRRGRQKKEVAEVTTDSETDTEAEAVPKRRGRQKKEEVEATTDSEVMEQQISLDEMNASPSLQPTPIPIPKEVSSGRIPMEENGIKLAVKIPSSANAIKLPPLEDSEDSEDLEDSEEINEMEIKEDEPMGIPIPMIESKVTEEKKMPKIAIPPSIQIKQRLESEEVVEAPEEINPFQLIAEDIAQKEMQSKIKSELKQTPNLTTKPETSEKLEKLDKKKEKEKNTDMGVSKSIINSKNLMAQIRGMSKKL